MTETNSNLERNLLIPILMVVVIGAPIVYRQYDSQKPTPTANGSPNNGHFQGYFDPSPSEHAQYQERFQSSLNQPYPNSNPQPSRNLSKVDQPTTNLAAAENPYRLTGFPRQFGNPSGQAEQDRFTGNPVNLNQQTPPPPVYNGEISREFPKPTAAPAPNSLNAQITSPHTPVPPQTTHPHELRPVVNGQFVVQSPPPVIVAGDIDFANMQPDYAAAETTIYPGNEFGPDLTAEPLENIPVADFREVFRFDLTKAWIQQRWKRVSTIPVDYENGLNGLRVALVTGSNSWDLHGSLTYFFDRQQELQRITFRGWTGNPEKLLQLLTTQYQFKSQPTSLAGFYLGENWRRTYGGLMMKTAAVIDADNPLQKYGLVMELNRPDGSYALSEDYRRLIAGSHPEMN